MAAPLCSCIMVTGKSPERRPFAHAAIRSFFDQAYNSLELIIVNDSGESLGVDEAVGTKRVREILVSKQPTLGHLRNIGLNEAAGEYIAQFDDDDFSASNRLLSQVNECIMRGCPTTLISQIRYSFVTGNAYINRQRPRKG